MTQPVHFLFTTCQVGAEAALKAEMANLHPQFRPAYSRPGFVTWKLPEAVRPDANFQLRSVFARGWGFSLGTVCGNDGEILARDAWAMAEDAGVARLHVWQRDERPPGDRGSVAGLTPLAAAAETLLHRAAPAGLFGENASEQLARRPKTGEKIMDCIVIEPNRWSIGYHFARRGPANWPGGLWSYPLPPHAVSRAYLKMQEALAWARFPLQRGMKWAEIGAAPGGASQALLDEGQIVLGVDPAEVDPVLLADPNFRHLRMRGKEVRRREFRGIWWLAVDVNVAPAYTLDMVEAIVTHRDVSVRGAILTLKLLDWSLAAKIGDYLDRIRSWGFRDVSARQLHHGGQEICVAALRHRSLRRLLSGAAGKRRPAEESAKT